MKRRVVDLGKLKRIRKQQMSLHTMSQMLGYKSPNGYYYLEKGRSKMPADILANVAIILDVPLEELFKDEK
ncbi:helix-turn-helix domain-containing protein [Tuberibacillus sp. Marseille-P3662]|uniref:helix-turn-helix domain-containing protein n=1 Tax=Tuberibacillus sp. Marseille-P3662 TaxID=1965358 RepID=UPI000A1CB8FE|nr:helix-turn-helix transcriptional regulator [Tuberibacillus sp. Marseille-P3662]